MKGTEASRMAITKKDFRILVVDDDPTIRTFMGGFCRVNGYDAEFASNGFDGLALLRNSGPFRLVIADFLMPRMHGVEFIRQVRREWQGVPIIAMSAWPSVEVSLIEAGASLFFAKPFDPYDLERAIEDIIRGT